MLCYGVSVVNSIMLEILLDNPGMTLYIVCSVTWYYDM